MASRSLLVLPLFLLACGDGKDDTGTAVDSDGDGLNDYLEGQLGTDPGVVDTDGDGLSDGEEYDLGTDGTLTDSDGDTYNDYHETLEGTDPTDPESRIYTGYWPYNPDKDSIDGEPLGFAIEQGQVVGRSTGPDQFGDTVDLYDYGYQGKYIMMDVSTSWCGYCQELSKLLIGQPSYFDGYGWEPLVEAVANGDIYWVTTLSQDAAYNAPTQETAAAWDENYAHELIPVIADEDQYLPRHVDVYGYPTVMLLDETMTLYSYDRLDFTASISTAIDLLGAR